MISNDQWKDIQEKLARSFVSVQFRWGDDEISVQRVSVSENKTALAVYLNGTIQPGKGLPDSDHYDPLVEKIWRKRSKAAYSPAKKAKIEKTFGKRGARQTFSNLDKTFEWFDPTFNTAASLVRQFKKLENLQLLKLNGVDVEAAA
ncbi:hypothetical protein [Oceanobacter kriegii]|uniref:hypothetical protein n=1 Tax=Oceanobacter kriegii TaxID=64972 RepID=UPI0004146EFE|nr:hypothetical protein [Oceanobacter kriegii]